MASRRRFDGFAAELGELPFEGTGVTNATPTPASIAAVVTMSAVTATGAQNATTSPASITAVVSMDAVTASARTTASPAAITAVVNMDAVTPSVPASTAPAAIVAVVNMPGVGATAGQNATPTPDSIAAVVTMTNPTTTVVQNATPAPAAIAAVVNMDAVSAFAVTGSTPAPAAIAATVSMTSPGVSGDRLTVTMSSESSWWPERTGVTAADLESGFIDVVTGQATTTGGDVLTGPYGVRVLVTFDPAEFQPFPDFNVMTIAQFGDVFLSAYRQNSTQYKIMAWWDVGGFVYSWLTVNDEEALTVGLAATRDDVTGEMLLYRSDDEWVTWSLMEIAEDSVAAGPLPDSGNAPLWLLSGDFADGRAWIQLFQAQWAETTDLSAFDANEVAAFNYGTNLTSGLGGDYFDVFDLSVKQLAEEGSRSSYLYQQQSEVVDGGRTVTVDWSMNVGSVNTATPPEGSAAAFVLDAGLQIPAQFISSELLPRVQFNATGTMSIASSMTPGVYGTTGERPIWRVFVVTMAGVPIASLPDAVVSSVKQSLNEPDYVAFSIPALSDEVALITCPDTEVQVWRGDWLVFWGPVVRSVVAPDVVDYQCQGVDWYWRKRIVGRPETNRIPNPTFQLSNGWFTGQYAPSEPAAGRNPAYWDSEIVNTKSIDAGGRSLHQTSTDDMTFGIQSISWHHQLIDKAVDPDGIVWTAVAWCYIDADEWEKERVCAYNWNGDSAPTGLTLTRMSTTEFEAHAPGDQVLPKLLDTAITSITNETPRNKWVRLEASLTQPASASPRRDKLQVGLGTPIGGVYWDLISLTRNERLRFNNVDQATIAAALVTHAQDPTYGKSSLNLTNNCPLTGIKRTRSYEFFNHELVSDSITEFTELWRGMDYSIQVSPTTRRFTTHYPMKGARRPNVPLILGKNIGSISIPSDGDTVSNRVVVMSDNGTEGSGREESYATDVSALNGGLILETAINGVKEAPVTTLKDQAQRAVRQYRSPAVIPVVTIYEGKSAEIIGVLTVGDVVPFQATVGALEFDGEYRIMEIEYLPDSETVRLTLNPFEEWNDPTRNWGVIT